MDATTVDAVDKEIDKTVEMGNVLGIQLEPFKAHIRSIIVGEGVCANGHSGGLLCIWNNRVFIKEGVIKNLSYMIISGSMRNIEDQVNIVNIYASNDPVRRRNLLQKILLHKNSLHGFWILMGDFNEVGKEEKRLNSDFNATNARIFNDFIRDMEVHEYQLGGGKFTYMSSNGMQHSKLDQFLVCQGFLNRWPNATALALAREYSDHRPVLLSTTLTDFGPRPFKTYNSWISIPGLLEFMGEEYQKFRFTGHADLALATKLRWLKYRIKEWMESKKTLREGRYKEAKKQLEELELVSESRSLCQGELDRRVDYMKFILEYDAMSQWLVLGRQFVKTQWSSMRQALILKM
ncbi:hypothetical protein E3N88_29841 [Mikania micrantha]|uniref:Endonuclease/exonuclease/phosphatase domain-containing protein n=1 Tax=Mikania micrantha TaxID=192012 RepID=A0A5N6MKI7_9ASTR|nr:hypothetical protein E3N88_29841 [Mikania micrantha]